MKRFPKTAATLGLLSGCLVSSIQADEKCYCSTAGRIFGVTPNMGMWPGSPRFFHILRGGADLSSRCRVRDILCTASRKFASQIHSERPAGPPGTRGLRGASLPPALPKM